MLNLIRLGAIVASSIVLMACGSDGPSRSQANNIFNDRIVESTEGIFEVKNFKIEDRRFDSNGDIEMIVTFDLVFAMNKPEIERALSRSNQLANELGVSPSMALSMMETQYGEIKKGRVTSSERQTIKFREFNNGWRLQGQY